LPLKVLRISGSGVTTIGKAAGFTVIINDMKKLVFIIFILLPSLALAQPVIKFSEDIHDFGLVKGNSSLEHTFEVRNEGTETLIINKVSPP
jgi:hypothetical protein